MSDSLKQLRAGAPEAPLYCLPGLGGYAIAFMPLALTLGTQRSIYGIQAQGLNPGEQPQDSVEAMAQFVVDEIRQVQPEGPYLLAGWSLGGLVALETARRLETIGQRTDLVAMFDTWLSVDDPGIEELDDGPVMEWIAPNLRLAVAELRCLPLPQRWAKIAERSNQLAGEAVAEIGRLAATCVAQLAAAKAYSPRPYNGRAVLFRAAKTRAVLDERWPLLCPCLEVETTPGDHYSILRRPDVIGLAERLERRLAVAPLATSQKDGKTVHP